MWLLQSVIIPIITSTAIMLSLLFTICMIINGSYLYYNDYHRNYSIHSLRMVIRNF